MKLAFLVFLSVVPLGCSPPPAPPIQCGSVVPPDDNADAGNPVFKLVVIGKPLVLTFSVRQADGCGPDSGVEVFTEVLDPSNQKVDHTHTPPTF